MTINTRLILVRKYFDSPDWVEGNCQTGQLIEDGFQQHYKNGQNLRSAFIGNDIKRNLFTDSQMPLLTNEDIFYLYSTSFVPLSQNVS